MKLRMLPTQHFEDWNMDLYTTLMWTREPVVFFDQLFTDELWDLLITETNRYARQANVNNWVDTTREEIRCFIGFLFGTSINKISQLDDIWSSDWVVASPAFAHFFTRDRILGLAFKHPSCRQ